MSSRERWIIYPLLVFAMALGSKDQLFEYPIKVSRVECKDLKLTNLDAISIQGDLIEAKRLKARVEMEANYFKADVVQSETIACTKLVAVAAEAGKCKTALVECDQIVCNRLAVISKDGKKIVEIGGTPVQAGGIIIYGPGDKPAVVLTVDEEGDIVWERLYPSGEDRDPDEKSDPEKEAEEQKNSN